MNTLLKIPLYILIFVCALWAVIFFGGAAVVTYITKSYFNEKVRLHRVQVTPNLDIQVGRLEFNFPADEGASALTGHALALELEWSIFNTKPSIGLHLGPVEVDGKAILQDTNFTFFFNSWSDFLVPEYFVTSGPINFLELFSVNNLEAHGNFNLEKGIVTNSLVRLNNFGLGKSDLVNKANILGSIKTYNLQVPVNDQKFSIEIESGYASSNLSPITFSGLQGEIKFDDGDFNLGAEINELRDRDKGINLERALFEVKYSDLDKFDLVFNFKKFWASETNLNISNGTGALTSEGNGAELKVAGEIESVDLKTNDQLIAEIRHGQFTATAITKPYREGFKVGSIGRISFSANKTPVFEFELETQVPDVISPLHCFALGCELNAVDANYTMDVAGEKLYGRFNCPIKECLLGSGNHDFKTVNTIEFFKALGDAKIFNPLFVALAYSQIIQGDSTENGHKLSIR